MQQRCDYSGRVPQMMSHDYLPQRRVALLRLYLRNWWRETSSVGTHWPVGNNEHISFVTQNNIICHKMFLRSILLPCVSCHASFCFQFDNSKRVQGGHWRQTQSSAGSSSHCRVPSTSGMPSLSAPSHYRHNCMLARWLERVTDNRVVTRSNRTGAAWKLWQFHLPQFVFCNATHTVANILANVKIWYSWQIRQKWYDWPGKLLKQARPYKCLRIS